MIELFNRVGEKVKMEEQAGSWREVDREQGQSGQYLEVKMSPKKAKMIWCENAEVK